MYWAKKPWNLDFDFIEYVMRYTELGFSFLGLGYLTFDLIILNKVSNETIIIIIMCLI